jgi:chitinase
MSKPRSRRLAALAAALLLPVSIAVLPGTGVAAPAAAGGHHHSSFKKVGYFIQWGIYGRSFFVKNLDTSGAAAKLTHVNYAFANVGQDGRCFEANLAGQGDAWADYQRPVGAEESVDGVADAPDQALKGSFNQLRKLKAKHPGLKAMISLGGWTWSKWFSDAALTKESRQAFVASCIDLFIKGNLPQLGSVEGGPGSAAGVFDGIDLDWEWPGSEGNAGNVIRPEDKQNFTKAVAEFRKQLDALGRKNHRHYELTAFLPAAPAKMDAGFEARKIFRDLDFATVQGYDFHGTWEATTNHQSALFEPRGQTVLPDFTADLAIDSWIARGAPRSKLVLGMPLYGRGWTGVPAANNGLFQTSTGGAAPGTWEAGVEDYKVLKTKVGAPAGAPFVVYRDTRAGFAWLFDGTTFWTFDDPAVMRQKTAFIRRNGLGGAMVWSLDSDTADAELVSAIDRGLR